MSRDHIETLIIGAGPTGLGAAWRLSTLGRRDWRLCEASATFGGLAGSVEDSDGFTWDLGGHVQHSHYAYFDALMDDLLGPGGWIVHRRESWIWIADRFVRYPFQLNLHHLPEAERDECLDGLREAARAGTAPRPNDFGEWIDATFGRGIARLFMRPYNQKVWAIPLEEMDWSWVGDRVALVSLEKVLDNMTRGRDDVSWGPNSQFRFPRQGGTGAVWRALGERLSGKHPESVLLAHRLVRLDSNQRVAHFDNGRCMHYERLLSTVPLDQLVTMSDQRERLQPAAAELRYTPVHVFGIALHGRPSPTIAHRCWMYFPQKDCPFHRVTTFSLYSPFNVPDASRYWSLLVEASEPPERAERGDSLVEPVIDGLVRNRLITRDQLHHVWHIRLERGYPVPTLKREAALAAILPALEAVDLYSRGRFGAWRYEVSNQDHSFAQGVEVVDRWLKGSVERTLNDPNGVNLAR